MALPTNKELKLLQGLIEFVRQETHYYDDDNDLNNSSTKEFLEELRDFCIFNNYLDKEDNLLRILSYLKD